MSDFKNPFTNIKRGFGTTLPKGYSIDVSPESKDKNKAEELAHIMVEEKLKAQKDLMERFKTKLSTFGPKETFDVDFLTEFLNVCLKEKSDEIEKFRKEFTEKMQNL